jgi:hypothetical protein
MNSVKEARESSQLFDELERIVKEQDEQIKTLHKQIDYLVAEAKLAKSTLPMSPEHLPQYIANNGVKPILRGGGGAGSGSGGGELAKPEQDPVGIGMRDAKYKDSTPLLHVGSSAFEDWFQSQPFATQGGIKQISRDSYAAGMGDPLVTYTTACKPEQEPAAFFQMHNDHFVQVQAEYKNDPDVFPLFAKQPRMLEQKQECETFAAKRKRLPDARFLKSPLIQVVVKSKPEGEQA